MQKFCQVQPPGQIVLQYNGDTALQQCSHCIVILLVANIGNFIGIKTHFVFHCTESLVIVKSNIFRKRLR